MECGVIALKAKTDKAGLRTMAYQVAQITTQAVKNDIKLIECIITFGGVKDILREIKAMDSKKRFEYLLIYSPSQICKDLLEYRAFVEILEREYKIQVKYIRSNL